MRRLVPWLAAFLLTGAAAVWQRFSGPTWPVTGSAQLPSGHSVRWRLPRSAEVGRDLPVSLEVQGTPLAGLVRCRRVFSKEQWQLLAVSREPGPAGYRLSAFLPAQPPAGKLAY